MAEPFSTGAAGTGLIKIFGVPMAASAAAVTLAFLFMWPKTLHEAAVRIFCTILASSFVGPLLVFMLHAQWPALFTSAHQVAIMLGAPSEFGILFVAGPVMTIAGLPAWWVLGGIVLWFEKRQGKDIGELLHDAKKDIA